MRRRLLEIVILSLLISVMGVSLANSSYSSEKIGDNSEVVRDYLKRQSRNGKNFKLVMFYSHRCHWCQLQQQSLIGLSQTYGISTLGITDEIASFSREFDETEYNLERLKEFQVRAYPTVFLWDVKANIKHRLTEGYLPQAELEEKLQTVLLNDV